MENTEAPSFTVRQAIAADIPTLARQRAAMFRDMGHLAPHQEEPLAEATAAYVRDSMARREYLAWLAEDSAAPPVTIGGAGVQLRPILPRPRPGENDLGFGPEAIVLNVYVELAWRRRGVGKALMVRCSMHSPLATFGALSCTRQTAAARFTNALVSR